ncbi:hypothetical protein PBR20603_04343 [Pandoraea bronchicola]|uniref:Uncharacterized protein n=1 Tax=Pandoraea bronchicola TaxID=2508287 RepID=A0A5E5C165_9BURK|nr:hypothetical protein PBR20603_04343 [Pandoraea bronchicola]
MSFEIKGIALFYGAFRLIVIPLPYHSRSPRNLLYHVAVATFCYRKEATMASILQVGMR